MQVAQKAILKTTLLSCDIFKNNFGVTYARRPCMLLSNLAKLTFLRRFTNCVLFLYTLYMAVGGLYIWSASNKVG
jgi:hypothetical protein